MHRRSPYAMFLAISFSLFVPIATAAEHSISDVVYGPAPGYQADPQIASDGQNFLVVWPDERSWPPVVYAARVTSHGELLDPTDIRLPFFSNQVRVVFAGDAYVVLWLQGSALYGLRIDRNGVPESPRLLEDNVPTTFFSAASNGSRIVAAWRDHFSFFGSHGELLQRDTPIAVPATTDTPAQVISNGSGFLLASWNSFSNPIVQIWALDSQGQPIGPIKNTSSSTTGSDISLATNGRDYLLIDSNVDTRMVESRRISGDGSTIGLAFPLASLAFAAANQPAAWDGSEYLLFQRAAASDQSGWPQVVQKIAIDADGRTLIGALSVVVNAFEIAAPVAQSNGRDVLLAWRGRRLYEDFSDIYAAVGTATQEANASGTLLSRSAVQQSTPSIAASSRNYAVVRQEGSSILLNRILPDGAHLDGAGLMLTPSTSLNTIAKPQVIFDGEHYIVGWMSGSPTVLHLARVQPDSGAVLDVGGIAVAETSRISSFDLASDGANSIVVAWSDGRIHAARFDRNLQRIDLRRGLTAVEMSAGNPVVAFNGSEWLIAFDDQTWCSVCLSPGPVLLHANVRAVRLTSAFGLLDSSPIAVAVDETEWNFGARVASDGNEFAIVWTNGPTQTQIRARHMKDGLFLDDALVVGTGSPTSLVWDGSRYAVAYEFRRPDNSSDAFVAHLGHAGEPLPRDPAIISATADDETAPRLVAIGTGNVIAAYVRVATEPLYGGVARDFIGDLNRPRTRVVRAR